MWGIPTFFWHSSLMHQSIQKSAIAEFKFLIGYETFELEIIYWNFSSKKDIVKEKKRFIFAKKKNRLNFVSRRFMGFRIDFWKKKKCTRNSVLWPALIIVPTILGKTEKSKGLKFELVVGSLCKRNPNIFERNRPNCLGAILPKICK